MVLAPHDLQRIAREDLAFFTYEHKPARERWVLDRWLVARGLLGLLVRPGGDPPDFVVDGCGVEVVELLAPGRRRTDQYRAKLKAAAEGHTLPRRMVSRSRVADRGHEWVLKAVEEKAKKYDPQASASWTLLIYVNLPWADCISWAAVEVGLVGLAPASPPSRSCSTWRPVR